jgi:ketosteroid isomerase-like protein
MNVSRRDFAVAGVFALGASSLLLGRSAEAASADEAALTKSIETLREGILKADKAKLDQVTAPQLSYGHSDGRVQNKAEFIEGVMTRKQVQKSLTFPELEVAVVGNCAIARHIYLGESELGGKQTTTRIGALQLWQKQESGWKLIARQGFKLEA